MGGGKIAIFVPSLHGGGAERCMVTLANGFAARGYAVDLVLVKGEGPYRNDVSPQVHIVDLDAGRVIKSLLPLSRYLRNERPVALLSALSHANVVAVLAHRLADVPTRLVVSEHNAISVERAHARGNVSRLVYRLVPWVYPRAHGIVAISQGVARDLVVFAKLNGHSVRTIYNPIEFARIDHMAAERVSHPWLSVGQRPVVLAIGRLAEQKDFATLLRGFALVRREHCARLLILGEGEERRALEILAGKLGLTAEDVDMPGFVSNPFAYLSRSAVFVLSSRWEGLPYVLLEAMACGTPVVSTDCPYGPREILEGGRWGKLVPVGNVEALAQAIGQVLSTPKAELPDVQTRAQNFDHAHAVTEYLDALGLPPRAMGESSA